jgi:hypothetical protein
MANTALVSFKVRPEHYTIIKAIALSRHTTVSSLVRQTVREALDPDGKLEQIVEHMIDQAIKCREARAKLP